VYSYFDSTSKDGVMEKDPQKISMVATILLVDDHQLFRKGLRLLLEKEQDIYNRASEAEDIRRLRTMLRDSASLKTASR
jgi:hypothetical protein